ncbi:YARHG domain-containing protein [Clostridium sp.]|uniref:YARHG domain-containing protein n=1 Tax=Clostridium sp. TaxID=1506 RepID=UPI003D6D03B1
MNCSKCGFQIDSRTKFCPNCGNEIIQNSLISEEKISTIYENGTAEKDTPENDTLEKRTPKKNRIVRSILITFLLVLILFSVGCISYYYSFSKYSTVTPKKSDKAPLNDNITPNKETSSDKDANVPASTDVTDKTKAADNDYIFPKSGSKKLLESDVALVSKDNLALAKNEIYGRHGYVFKSEPFKSYFNSKSWYKPDPNFKASNTEFNTIESYNINLILKHQNK